MMDDVVEFLGKLVAQMVKVVFYVFFWQTLLFNLGRLVLLGITLGKYPIGNLQHKDHEIASWVGFLVIFIAWLSVVIHNRVFV